ncbi:hypothetical protein D3C75_1144640 [compost metagenome]
MALLPTAAHWVPAACNLASIRVVCNRAVCSMLKWASLCPVRGYMWPYEPAAQKMVESGKPADAATASADIAPIATMLPNGNA